MFITILETTVNCLPQSQWFKNKHCFGLVIRRKADIRHDIQTSISGFKKWVNAISF